MTKTRVLLGMSGGTDSSVAAIILKEKLFEVIGITFLFANADNINENIIRDASEISEKLKIEHHIIDLRKEFENIVIKRFVHEYINGKTPFPCAFCNPDLKFKYLKRYAKILNCQYIATGHYANIVEFQSVKYVSQADDKDKDQSFFLWGLKNKIIRKLIFPLGNWNKTDVRKFAKEKGFDKIEKKKDSLGICFIEGNDYRNWFIKNGITAEPGNFVDIKGKVLGKHKGIINYTIGQRHGIGINTNKRLFVSDINAKENIIVLSDYHHLFKSKIFVNRIHCVNYQSIKEDIIYILRIRYRLQENPCYIKIIDSNRAVIELIKPVAMVAKGQAAVLYDNDRVIAGGFIEDSK